jgi:hypothetical protein
MANKISASARGPGLIVENLSSSADLILSMIPGLSTSAGTVESLRFREFTGGIISVTKKGFFKVSTSTSTSG